MTTTAVTPPDLELIQTFVNTGDIEGGSDRLATPETLREWLHQHDLAADGEAFSAEDVFTARELREALRALLFHNNGGPLDPAAVDTLNRMAAGAPLRAAFAADGAATLAPADGGFAAVTAQLLAAVARAEAEGTWWRLKACAADTCRWAYYDHSRNRSRQWCSMGVCGNRAKARKYRERRKSA